MLTVGWQEHVAELVQTDSRVASREPPDDDFDVCEWFVDTQFVESGLQVGNVDL